MFSRTRGKDKDKDAAAEAFAADLVQNPPAPAPRRSPGRAAPSILCSDMTVIGTLACSGDMHIDGRIEGEIFSTCLTIGEKAVVNGDIRADECVIRGHVRGNIRARKVSLASTCHVDGDITHNNGLSVETGAYFQGNIRNAEQVEPAMSDAEAAMEEAQYYRDQQRATRRAQRPPQAPAAPVSQAAPPQRARSTFANAAPPQQGAQPAPQARSQMQAAPGGPRPDSTDKLTEALQKLNAQGPSARPRPTGAAPPPPAIKR